MAKMFMGSETNNFKVYLRSRFKKVSSAKPRYGTIRRLSSLSHRASFFISLLCLTYVNIYIYIYTCSQMPFQYSNAARSAPVVP